MGSQAIRYNLQNIARGIHAFTARELYAPVELALYGYHEILLLVTSSAVD